MVGMNFTVGCCPIQYGTHGGNKMTQDRIRSAGPVLLFYFVDSGDYGKKMSD